ncbi:MAG: 5'-3' exonuclease H3TH domain-containing protein, partial [Actinomycetota bacterium]
MTESPRRLFLLDGHSLAYRAFFALPQTLATSSGTVTNAVYGFTSMLIKLLGDEHPDLLAVAFDMGAPTVRLELDADYKAGRPETPADFRPQLGLIEEVLDVLNIPVIRMAGHEADDAIGTLATQAGAQGLDVVIVTADRDFFQLVRDRTGTTGAIGVLFNRRGISEIDRMDPAAVEAKYGVTPAQYLDFVALKGDTSDNIPGVPGIGEKTAAKLVVEFGSVEELLAHSDRLKGKQKENVEAAADRLALNKQLARIVTDVPLEVAPEDCEMGAYDPEQVRSLFTSLEFRSLLDRLYEAMGSAKPMADVAELDLRQATAEEVGLALTGGAAAFAVRLEDARIRGAAVSPGGAQASYTDLQNLDLLAAAIGDPAVAKTTHDAKTLERAVTAEGRRLSGVVFDTLIGGYLLDPGATDYTLGGLSERYLGADLLAGIDEDDGGQLFAEDPWRLTAAAAAAVGLLVPVMEEQIDKQGLRALLEDVELPLSSVLARMEARGIRLDTDYLGEMGEGVRDRMATRRAEIYEIAGREFNLNSPPQLREVLYGELG